MTLLSDEKGLTPSLFILTSKRRFSFCGAFPGLDFKDFYLENKNTQNCSRRALPAVFLWCSDFPLPMAATILLTKNYLQYIICNVLCQEYIQGKEMIMKEKIVLLILAWTLGIWAGGLLLLLILLGRIGVRGYHWKKFTSRKKGMIVICNHPSLVEPGILPFLFFPWYLVFPRFAPISTPDERNYYNKLWFTLLRPVCIPIRRNAPPREALGILRKMRGVAEKGGILILFPEGGRTFKGDKFISLKNRRIRKFPTGISYLFDGLNCFILPIWVEGTEKILPNKFNFSEQWPFFRFWRKAGITIGKVIDSRTLPEKKKINKFLENVLLGV